VGKCGKKAFCCLEFLLLFFKKKVIGPAGYEATNVNCSMTVSISLGGLNQLSKSVDVLSFFPQKRKNQRKNSRLVPCSMNGQCRGLAGGAEQANAGLGS
jgi:hypothetical protein